MGGSGLHVSVGAREWLRLLASITDASACVAVFRRPRENAERDIGGDTHYQVLCMGGTVWKGGGSST